MQYIIMAPNSFACDRLYNQKCQAVVKSTNSTRLKMNRCQVKFVITVMILATLPYCSTLNLPSGDPAPGRSPGPPPDDSYFKLDDITKSSDANLETNIEVPVDEVVYDETTTNDEVTTVSDVNVSERTVSDACAFARIPSDSDEIFTVSDADSDVNITISHPVFEADELVRGAVYDVHIQYADGLRDYVIYSIVGNRIRGNFTPTSFSEKPCRDEESLPYFVPKHSRTVRSKHKPKRTEDSGSGLGFKDRFDESFSYRTRSDSDVDLYYFRPKFRSNRDERSVSYRVGKKYRKYTPARIVSGPLEGRAGVMLHWSVLDGIHAEDEETRVVFRLRYRKTTSTTIYQVFFTKILRLECAIRLRAARSGKVHSGHLPRTHGCRILLPPLSPKTALLINLHKLNVPCSSGFIRFAPNTPSLCGKLEQIPVQNRKFLYQSSLRNQELELHGRPSFAATFRLVDHCHDVLLTVRNGSFEVGPTVKLFCSYEIHLPYGNRVALRLQMGTGPMEKENENSNIIHEDHLERCKGMELNLEDGDSRWRHCSQPGDPLRSVQIISESNSVRLNISVLGKKNSSSMWLKVWWMDKPLEDIVGHCDYGWVVSGDFCITAVREAKKAWRQAEAECVRLGGHLASILNERQQHITDQLLLNAPGAGIDDVYWIGATDVVHEGEFRWSDGLPFSYAHWFPGWRKHSSQPNDDGVSGQDCVEIRRALPPRPAHPTFMWNDRGCREHNYFVCERPGVDDPYTASKVQCNETIVLSHSHPHATVASPGFPRPYPDDAACVTEIRAPPAHTLKLHFEELLTEHEPHCSYDFLELEEPGGDNSSDEDWPAHDHHPYSGDNEVWEELETLLPESDAVSAGWSRDSSAAHSRRLCGDWGGKLKLLRYQSRANLLRLRFRSDHSRHYAGYRAKITLADSQSCMDVKQVLFNGHCYLFAGYPRASWVTARQVCEGLNMNLASIHSPEEERFVVAGIRQSNDYSAGSIYWLGARQTGENLSWVDGSDMGYQAWPPYNDTEEVEDACLGVQWKTSPVPSLPSGLYWTLHKCLVTGGYVCKRRLNPQHIFRNLTVEGTSGELSSPNHPGVYDNDVDWWTHVVGPLDTRLVFVFHTIDLEYQNDCLYDYIELSDRVSLKSSRYCGSLGETRWVAASNEAVLHFHSDYNTPGKGFSVHWRAVELAGCPSQTFTSHEGVVRSPNYPHFLLPALDCRIDILAPAGKRVFLNISYFDFGYGAFSNGVPLNVTDGIPEDNYLEIQVDPQSAPVRPFLEPRVLTSGLFLSQAEVMRLRLRTAENVTGVGFIAYFKTVGFLNVSHTLELAHVRSGRLSAPNWPGAPPRRARLRTRVLAPHGHTLSAAFERTRLVPPTDRPWPCGDGRGWIEVKDSYTDNNGTQWILCAAEGRSARKVHISAPLVINSYLHSLVVTQHAGDRGVDMDVALIVNTDPDYHSKVLLLPDETALESCEPSPCAHGGRCVRDGARSSCQCASYYTGAFCLVTSCERSPCVFGNCSLGGEGGFTCACARGWRGRRCAERVRPCAARPCNHRGACVERDGGFLCQCTPSWKGKRCEIPNPTPNIVGLGTRMLQEPFWLGLIAVFVVLGIIGLVWCAKRHFPEKIEKLLAEEADRCARPAARATGEPHGPHGPHGPHRTLLTRLGIRKPSVSGLARPRAARTFSLDDLLKPPPGLFETSSTPSSHNWRSRNFRVKSSQCAFRIIEVSSAIRPGKNGPFYEIRTSGNPAQLTLHPKIDVQLRDEAHSYLPPADQLKKLADLKCSSSELTEAEQFAATVADVKRLGPRLRSLAFREHYAEIISEVKPDIVSGTAACEEVKSSKKFAKILELLLLLGNYMNTGSNNAGAYGFEISFITKLTSTKDLENKHTLLHYLVETIENKFPDVLSFAEEMPHIDRAARVSMENLQKALKKMDNDIRALETDLNNSRVPQCPDDLFHETMSSFAVEAREQCDLLHSMCRKMEALYGELAEYYVFDPHKYTLEEFFQDLKTFKDSFASAHQEVVVARETAERARRAREARAAAERERRDRQHRYKQFVDMETAQEGVMDSLMEALQSGSAFSRERPRKKANPRVAGAERRAQLSRSRSRSGLTGPLTSRELANELLSNA